MGGDHQRRGTATVGSLPARIQQVVTEYRRELARLEAEYTRTVGPARAMMRRRLRDEFGRFMRDLRNAGLPERVTRRWVTDHAGYQRLLRLAEAELDRVTSEAVRAMQWQIAEAAQLGKPAADALVAATLAASPAEAALLASTFGQIPIGAVEQLVGQLQSSSPLANLPRLNAEAVEAMGRELTRGLVRGDHSRVIARRIAAASDIPLARAQTIARTELHRSYRESNRAAYRANPLVGEWIWHSAGTTRTCAACWAMHGTIHSVDEAMSAHVNCRCTQLPKVTPPAWMTDAPDVQYPTGTELFAELPAADQRAILGRDKFAAFERGDIALSDVVKVNRSAEWGESRTVASLSQAMASAG